MTKRAGASRSSAGGKRTRTAVASVDALAHWEDSRRAFAELCAAAEVHWLKPFLDKLKASEKAAVSTPLETDVERAHFARYSDNSARFLPTRSFVLEAVELMADFFTQLSVEELQVIGSAVGVSAQKRNVLQQRILLPWLVHSEDTLHMYRLFRRWRDLALVSTPVTAEKIAQRNFSCNIVFMEHRSTSGCFRARVGS